MNSSSGNSFTCETFVSEYNILRGSHNDKPARDRANHYVMNFQRSQEAWGVSRELLQYADQQLQFMGAHILQMKVRQNFMSINGDQFLELRGFLFSTVETRTDLSVPTLNSLCLALAALAVVGIGFGQWETVIADIIPFMQKGQTHLWIGLSVMQGIKENLDEMIIGNNVKQRVFSVLSGQSAAVTSIFNSLLSLDDSQIVKKSLECLQSWVGFRIPMLSNETLTGQIVRHGQVFPQLVCEVLAEICNHAEGGEALAKAQLLGTSPEIDAKEQSALEIIIRMIGALPVSIHTSDLFIQIINTFPTLLMGEASMREGLFNMLIQFTNCKELKVSACTIKFIDAWTKTLKQYVKQPPAQQTINPSFITNLYACPPPPPTVMPRSEYLEIFYRLLESFLQLSMKRSSVKISKQKKRVMKIIDLETNEETRYVDPKNALQSDDEDNSSDEENRLEVRPMSLHQYRESCQEAFYQIFAGLRDFLDAAGVNKVYSLIFQLLDPANKTAEQSCLQAEIALYAAGQFVELESVKIANINVQKILSFIFTRMPISDITLQTSIQYIFEAARELSNTTELFHPAVTFLIAQFTNEKIRAQSAQCLISVIEYAETHEHLETLELLAGVFIQAFSDWKMIDLSMLQQLIQAILVFTVKLKDEGSRQQAIVQFLSLIQSFLTVQHKKLVEGAAVEKELCSTLDILTSVFQGFESMDMKYRSYASKILGEFCQVNLPAINELFKRFAMDKFKAYYMRFISLYTFLVKACGVHLPESFLGFLTTALEVLQINPTKYFASLRLFQKVITEAAKNASFTAWITQHYAKVNAFLLTFLSVDANRDPDLMANYFAMSRNMHLYFESVFFAADFQATFSFALHSLIGFEDYIMAREILGLLSKLTEKPSTQVSIDFSRILGTIIKATTLLQRAQVAALAMVIIQSVMKIADPTRTVAIISANLDCVPEVANNEEQKQFIGMNLLAAANTGRVFAVKKVMSSLFALASGLSDFDAYQFEISLMATELQPK